MKMLWITQIVAIIRLELKKTFFAKRGLWIYLLALLPVVIFAGHSIEMMVRRRPCDFGQDTNIFATVFQLLNLRLVFFFGCLGIFINLFRGEVLDRSLHYYFLAPVRREVLVVGKYLAGLTAATVIFTTSTILGWVVLQLHFPATVVMTYLRDGNGWSHVMSYAATTILACVGYGSVFLLAGAIFKNPIIPAAIVAMWESISTFLPGILQKFSVTYYLKSLCPIEATPDVPPPFSMLIVNADPISPVIAVAGMLLFTCFVLVVAAVKVRHMEIAYGTE
jgi:ABC-type transport system involved in multi-copper enzyme maturation permease subunit